MGKAEQLRSHQKSQYLFSFFLHKHKGQKIACCVLSRLGPSSSLLLHPQQSLSAWERLQGRRQGAQRYLNTSIFAFGNMVWALVALIGLVRCEYIVHNCVDLAADASHAPSCTLKKKIACFLKQNRRRDCHNE